MHMRAQGLDSIEKHVLEFQVEIRLESPFWLTDMSELTYFQSKANVVKT